MKLLLLGPHGAGKSTQAHLLSARLHIPYISTGAMLRTLASQPGEMGETVRRRLESGDYFKDQEMIPLVLERLHQVDTHHGYILEGFPRTLAQARALPVEFDRVIYLEVPDTISVERLLARHRPDDTRQVILHRLEQYHAEEQPILEYYQQRLIRVDASQPVEVVQAQINVSLGVE